MAEVRHVVALETSEGAVAAPAPRDELAQGEVDPGEHELGQGGLA